MVAKICTVLRIIILAVLIAIAAFMIVPKLLGYETLCVLSGSMTPGIPVGSVVITKDVEFEDVQVGDVITYDLGEGTKVTHRIIEKDDENRTMITKGDANDVPDLSPVCDSQLFGKMVFSVPFLGYISMYIRTGLGIGIICALVIVVILLSVLPSLLSKDDESDEAVKENASKDDESKEKE